MGKKVYLCIFCGNAEVSKEKPYHCGDYAYDENNYEEEPDDDIGDPLQYGLGEF